MRHHLLLALPLLLVACGDDTAAESAAGPDAQLLADYADHVVVPTYALLADRAEFLHAAADALGESPSAQTLLAAQDAWVAAREPWELSEGFLFGPVDTYGYDPAMDSWPVNQTDLEAVLASSNALTPDFVASLAPELRGFHTIEYLLFGQDRMRDASELDARKLEFLVALTADLSATASALAASWTAPSADFGAYRDVLATAGESSNAAYPSVAAGLQELVNGMSVILDEVANGKIAEPFDNRDPDLVESQFSFNSEVDFADNVRSVQNAYSGDCPICGTESEGLDAWVAAVDPELAVRLSAELSAALAAIEAMPDPFRDAITDPGSDAQITAAQDALRTLDATVREQLLPLVLQ